jgi:regulator of protease activity HflC (stomatin/prohibitin superfamily)
MFTLFIGLLILIAGIVFKILKSKDEARSEKIRQYNEENPATPKLQLKSRADFLPFSHRILIGIGSAILFFGAFFYANSGTVYAVQYPWGGDKMVATQGISVSFYGKTIPISFEMSAQDVILKPKQGESAEDFQERRKKALVNHDGIYNRQASQWEFSDAIKADIATAVVLEVDITDEARFLNMADRNRSEGKLMIGRVLPNIDAALKNTAKLMDAQEYISGKASDFDRYFRDQLENGMYLVEEYTPKQTTPEIIGDTATVRTIGGNSNQQKKWRIKRDSQGNIVRDNKSNTLTQYGIRIVQAQVTGIDWEPSFDKRLQLQKEQVAQTQLEKQEAEKEYYRAKKEVAKGESEKAKERARLEKDMIKQTISAKTEAEVAKQNVIAERQKLEVEQLRAKSTKVAADAEAYKNQRLVTAGLTPQERAEWEFKTKIGVARELKSLELPQIYIEGGSKGSEGSLLESLIGSEMAKGMLNTKK